MKFFIAIALFVVSANALRKLSTKGVDFKDERSASNYARNALLDIGQYIKDLGFDPLYVQKQERNYTLPVPVIFNTGYMIEELLSNGMSNIVLNSIFYEIITSRFYFDIELPLIDGSVGAASTETTVFGKTFKMNSSGKVEVKRMRFVGNMRMHLDLNDGISVKSTKVNFTMGGIEADVKLAIMDVDFSKEFNVFFNHTIPETFKAYSSEINELLEIMLLHYANEYFRS